MHRRENGQCINGPVFRPGTGRDVPLLGPFSPALQQKSLRPFLNPPDSPQLDIAAPATGFELDVRVLIVPAVAEICRVVAVHEYLHGMDCLAIVLLAEGLTLELEVFRLYFSGSHMEIGSPQSDFMLIRIIFCTEPLFQQFFVGEVSSSPFYKQYSKCCQNNTHSPEKSCAD